MTRANAEHRQTPWYAQAGAGCSIVPISRFVDEHLFALKGGGYGCLFSLAGVDEESLTEEELGGVVRSVEGTLRGLPEGASLFQYTRLLSAGSLPKASFYPHPATERFVADRTRALEASGLRRIDLFWCLAVEPAQAAPFSAQAQCPRSR